jgi:hypothetical protein
MSYVHIVLFCMYANHDCITSYGRIDYGDECDCHRLYVRFIYWANFSFDEEQIWPICCMISICMCMIELNFEEQIENKLEVNSNRKNKTRNVTQL